MRIPINYRTELAKLLKNMSVDNLSSLKSKLRDAAYLLEQIEIGEKKDAEIKKDITAIRGAK